MSGVVLTPDGHPSIPESLIRELKALSPRLGLVWSEFILDPEPGIHKGLPLIHETTGFPVHYSDGKGRWHVVLAPEDGGQPHYLFTHQTADGTYLPADSRISKKIREDAGRTMSADQINRMVELGKQAEKRKYAEKYASLQDDTLRANKTKIEEMFDNVERGIVSGGSTRDQKIVSYPGQTDRGTHHDNIPMSSEEQGWELPDYAKEMADE